MVWVKMSYPEDPIAAIFVVVAWPEVAYEIVFYKKCSKRHFSKIVPVPDRGVRFRVIWGSPGAHLG